MKQKLITDFFSYQNDKNKKIKLNEKIFGYNPKTNSWHCTICGIDMGEFNSRQLCRKTYCENDLI